MVLLKTTFLGDKIPKEGVHCACIACNYRFCYENEKNELWSSLFRRMQVQDEKTS